MPLKGNNVIANVHCKKKWMERVKVHLNQPGKKKTRRVNRAAVRPRSTSPLPPPPPTVALCRRPRHSLRPAGSFVFLWFQTVLYHATAKQKSSKTKVFPIFETYKCLFFILLLLSLCLFLAPVASVQKFAAIAPRPTGGALRPVVRCATFKYNTKVRAGRGFTLGELKGAGISAKKAGTIGIAVDHRRMNKSTESLLINVERLKAYMGNLVTFPKKGKGAAPAVAQFQGTVMPIAQAAYKNQSRAITAEEKSANVFRDMRIARADARMVGIRQKKQDEAAAKAALKKK